MQIWICDDDPAAAESLRRLLREQGQSKTEWFCDPADIIEEANTNRSIPDVVFMDISFDREPKGFACANALWKLFPELPIIFITAFSRMYAQEVLLECPKAAGYMIKPFDREILHRYLEKVEKERESGSYLVVKKNGQIYTILEKNILYLESHDHNVYIISTFGTLRVYEKLSSLRERLSSQFCSCHKSYIVNLSHVRSCLKESFILDTDKKIPIARSVRKECREKFFNLLQAKIKEEGRTENSSRQTEELLEMSPHEIR